MLSASRENNEEALKPRCHVAFSVAGSSLDLKGISTTLGQKSAETRQAGSRVSAALEALKSDAWWIGSPLGPLKPLQEHLQWLNEQLEPHVDYLAALSRSARLRVYIGFTFSQEQNGFAIPVEFVRLLASFNALLEVFILCNCSEDSDEA
jgi:hypothetical protein